MVIANLIIAWIELFCVCFEALCDLIGWIAESIPAPKEASINENETIRSQTDDDNAADDDTAACEYELPAVKITPKAQRPKKLNTEVFNTFDL